MDMLYFYPSNLLSRLFTRNLAHLFFYQHSCCFKIPLFSCFSLFFTLEGETLARGCPTPTVIVHLHQHHRTITPLFFFSHRSFVGL